MELIKDDVALLDKVVIYNFSVLDIDNISVLQDKGIVTVKERAKDYIHTIFGELYSSISIDKTIAFDKFTYAISPIGIYACLELSVDDVDG